MLIEQGRLGRLKKQKSWDRTRLCSCASFFTMLLPFKHVMKYLLSRLSTFPAFYPLVWYLVIFTVIHVLCLYLTPNWSCSYVASTEVRYPWDLSHFLFLQYMSPSAGWLRFLLATISFLIATSIFSMVVSEFQFLKRWNLLGSRVPFDWLTEGMLIFELNFTCIGTDGYWLPQVIDMK